MSKESRLKEIERHINRLPNENIIHVVCRKTIEGNLPFEFNLKALSPVQETILKSPDFRSVTV